MEEHLLQQTTAELSQVQKQVEMLLEENRTQLQALEEEMKRTQIQVSTGLNVALQLQDCRLSH